MFFSNHLHKLCICEDDDPLSSVHIYLLVISIGLPYFHRKKGEQFTTLTYLSVLSTLHKSYQLGLLISIKHCSKTYSVDDVSVKVRKTKSLFTRPI